MMEFFVPLCASFAYGLMCLHKFSACIIPVLAGAFESSPEIKHQFAVLRIFFHKICNAAFCSVRDVLLSLHIIEALNCFRLRLGFDLFSHSSHNLIKDFGSAAEHRRRGSRGQDDNRKFPFMGEGGCKDEHIHCDGIR